MTTNEKQTPLEVLASGAVARVLKTEGDWYLIEFEGARWGRRVGYLKSTAIDLGQQPMDLSVPEPELRPMDLSVPDSQQLEPMDLSVPSVK
jgi:hypothetical protein